MNFYNGFFKDFLLLFRNTNFNENPLGATWAKFLISKLNSNHLEVLGDSCSNILGKICQGRHSTESLVNSVLFFKTFRTFIFQNT